MNDEIAWGALRAASRMARIVAGLAIFTAHLALLVFLLALAWAFQIGPDQAWAFFATAYQRIQGPMLLAWLGFLGVSGAAIALGWWRLWMWLAGKAISKFVWSNQTDG